MLYDMDYVRSFVFVFNWGGIKPRQTPDKDVWPNPISVSMGDKQQRAKAAKCEGNKFNCTKVHS